MTIALGLIVSRFLHYLALSLLFGAALFPLYGLGLSPARAEASLPWLRGFLLLAAIAALISGLSWLSFATAGMSGNLSGAIDPESLSIVIGTTSFGRLWSLHLALAALVILLLLPKGQSAARIYAVLAASFVLLAGIAGTGHAGENSFDMIADGIHLLAAAIWIGALFVLLVLVTVAADTQANSAAAIVRHALVRFSGIGTSLIAVLVLSGLVNSWYLIGLDKLDQLFVSRYEEILLVKLVLFGAMLLLAAANRFWLTPRLAAALASGSKPAASIRPLGMSILGETVLGIGVLAAVAWLGTLQPPALE